MRQRSGTRKEPAEKVVRDIRRATRKHYGAEEKIRIVLEGLRGEEPIAALCRREGIAESLYYNWSKDFLEAGKKRMAGDTARAATTDEVKTLLKEARDLKDAEEPVGVLAKAHRQYSARYSRRLASTATTDARFFGLYGDMPALVYGPRAELIHGFDERVSLTSIRNVTKAMTLFIADWCGLAEAG